MLKTNSKAVKQKIRAYIIEHFNAYYYPDNKDYIDQELKDEKAIFCYIVKTIKKEKSHDIKRNYNFLSYEIFKDYCQGLPSVLNCDYYVKPAVNLLGDILEQTNEERNKYNEEQAEELMTRLLYRELVEWA